MSDEEVIYVLVEDGTGERFYVPTRRSLWRGVASVPDDELRPSEAADAKDPALPPEEEPK